jgi:hypothetical protein
LGIAGDVSGRLSQADLFLLTIANKKRNISAVPGLLAAPFDTLLASESLARGAENTCTKVQVFHRQYRENEAKTEAKVVCRVTYLFSIIYKILL